MIKDSTSAAGWAHTSPFMPIAACSMKTAGIYMNPCRQTEAMKDGNAAPTACIELIRT